MGREEAKAERLLKELLRLPYNKRCANCEAVGPQYVCTSGSSFAVFVCTVCSGVHRGFGHRVKGVSMSTFKPEEVAALQLGANARFAASYLARWNAGALPKPVDRDTVRLVDWIGAVYQERRFFAELPWGWGPPTALGPTNSSGSATTSDGREVMVKPLSEVLGTETPRLKVTSSAHSGLERSVSKASSTGVDPESTPTKPAHALPPTNLLEMSSPKTQLGSPKPRAAAEPWDPFNTGVAAAAEAPQAATASLAAAPAPAAAPAGVDSWAAFDDEGPAAPAVQAAPVAAAAAPPVSAAAPVPAAASAPAAQPTEPSNGGWEAFSDSSPSSASVPAAMPNGAAAPAPQAEARPVASPSGGPAQQPEAPAAQPLPPKESRPEVPLDIFYPEFEQIRATGMLPTGQPVPRPMYAAPPQQPYAPAPACGMPPQPAQQQQAYYGGVPQPQHYQPHPAAYGYAPPHYAPQQQQHPGMQYGHYAPQQASQPRPPLVIPQGPMQPPSYVGVSPAYSQSSGYSPASMVSPAGSGFSAVGSMPYANGVGGYGSHASLEVRSSTSSLPDLASATPAPTSGAAASYKLGDPAADPFADLAPKLRAAMPRPAAASSPMPQFGGQPSFGGGPVVGMPYHVPPPALQHVPLPAVSAPAAAATATLYGQQYGGHPSVAAYDLTAPAAPKPNVSGNPFA